MLKYIFVLMIFLPAVALSQDDMPNQCLEYTKFAEAVAGDRDNGAARMDVRSLIASKELVDWWSYDYAFDIIDYVYTLPHEDPIDEAKQVYLSCTGGIQSNYEF